MIAPISYLLVVAALFLAPRAEAELRIINGQPSLGGLPALGAIKTSSQPEAVCSGVLVAKRWALTAGHCLRASRGREIVFDRPDLRFAGGQRRAIVDTVLHPDYRWRSAANDFGLLYLGAPVKAIRPLKVGARSPRPGQRFTVAGWGKTAWGSEGALQRMKTEMTVTGKRHCRSAYPQLFDPLSMLCVSTGAGRGTCLGDSGSPALIGATIVGLVSQGRGCGDPEWPEIYARTAVAKQWIEETIRSRRPRVRDRAPGPERRYNPLRLAPYSELTANPSLGRYQLFFYLYFRQPVEGITINFPLAVEYCDGDQICSQSGEMERLQDIYGQQDWGLFGTVDRPCFTVRWQARFPDFPARSGRYRICSTDR